MDLAVVSPIQRSGSTLAQRICNTRAKTLVWGENGGAITYFHAIWKHATNFSKFSEPERAAFFGKGKDANTWIANLTPEMPFVDKAIVTTVRSYFSALYEQHRQQHDLIGFKEVRYGRGELDLLRMCFSQMRFILLVRNPLDCWNSCSSFEWFKSVNEFAKIWNDRAKGYLPFAQDCVNARLVRYEDLTNRASKALQVFREFAQVDDEAMESVLKVKLNSTPQGVTAAEAAVITEVCGETMEALGYDLASLQSATSPRAKTAPPAMKDLGSVSAARPEIDNGWRNHFATLCEYGKGRGQTAIVMRQLIEQLTERERAFLGTKDLRILDWGCALGEGVQELGIAFPKSHVAGLDFSEEARAKASTSYPSHEFIANHAGEISGKWDVIVNANCLEYFEDPLSLFRSHLPSCLSLYVVLAPHREFPLSHGRSQLREEFFPANVDGFTRLFTKVGTITCDNVTTEQLIVAYASRSYLEHVGVTVESLDSDRRVREEVASAGHLAAKLSRQIDELDSALSTVAGQADTRLTEALDNVDSRFTSSLESIGARVDSLLTGATARLTEALDRAAQRESQLESQRRTLITELRREEERFTQSQIELRAHLAERDATARRLEEELRDETEQSLELCRVLKAKIHEAVQAQQVADSSQQRVSDLQQKLAEAEQHLRSQVMERDAVLQNDVVALARHSGELAEHLDYAQRRLAEIQSCRGWRMLKVMWWVRLKLMPRHSYREKAAHTVLRAARRAAGRAAIPAPPLTPALPPVPAVSTATVAHVVSANTSTNAPAPAVPATVFVNGRLPCPEMSEQQAGRVHLLTGTFFNFDGADMFCGGAERYLVELARIIRDLGYRPIVYQCARDKDWTRWYNDLEVRGLAADGNMDVLTERFHREIPVAALTIYSPFSLAYPHAHAHSLAISHGVWWDHACFHTPDQAEHWRGRILQSIRNCERMISVDTNTINYVRATDYESSTKLAYIPNFVDTDVFHPHPRNSDRVVVLYPRRLYGPRGFWLLADLAPRLLERYPEVDIHFVGKADAKETEAVESLRSKFPGRITWRHYEPDDMHKAYADADISLIPTVNSEGTSLSCLEAMASGNAVIATNVGGLPDLVLDGYNGLLIEPTSDRLWHALTKLLDNPELREQLGRNARDVSFRFAQDVWQNRWRETISEMLPERVQRPVAESIWTVVHPQTPGIDFHTRKQRPQQLLQAIAEQGHHAFFVNDSGVPAEVAEIEDRIPHLHVVESNDAIQLTRPVVYVYYAYEYQNLKRWTNPIVIYDILDAPEIHKESDRIENKRPGDDTLHYHQRLLEEAEIVLTSSEELHERYRAARPDILLVPNATRAEDFEASIRIRPKDLPPMGTKIIGYYGAIAEWFDFKLMSHVAAARPEYNFVLIGVTNQQERLRELVQRNANVHYLGEKRYDELPAYLAHFDATTIPFMVNGVTNAVSPVKLFEYMSGGKPTVSTDLYECRKYDTVLIAKSPQEFVSQLDKATRLVNDSQFVERLHAGACENSWAARAKLVLEALDQRASHNLSIDTSSIPLRKSA